MGWIPRSGRSPGGGNSIPLQYSYLENPMDRRTWWATVHGATEWDMTETIQHAYIVFQPLVWINKRLEIISMSISRRMSKDT